MPTNKPPYQQRKLLLIFKASGMPTNKPYQRKTFINLKLLECLHENSINVRLLLIFKATGNPTDQPSNIAPSLGKMHV